ncbi:hypothetical protein P8Q88_12905 [Qipengyuania sp. XHP0207]|uniref:hypothetical protein n=1 Tax=Qipengyuania sp. XHP0207 TaxID=3038078 RepID=UPI0024201502|nr:hypothetical protein [Qipengyuania sp. XHP0207]MDG5749076.1 hypothetical protein [Qipengyuania sp. XHP0207]
MEDEMNVAGGERRAVDIGARDFTIVGGIRKIVVRKEGCLAMIAARDMDEPESVTRLVIAMRQPSGVG